MFRKNQFDSAFTYFQLAFDQIQKGITENDILMMPVEKIREFKKINYVTRLIIDKGEAYLHYYSATGKPFALSESLRIFKKADQLLDLVRMEQSDLNSKLFWRADNHRLYELAIEASFRNGDMMSAFYFFERSRASLLNDQLHQQQWLDEDDISKLTQLKKKIIQLGAELRNGNTTVKPKKFNLICLTGKKNFRIRSN